MNKIVPRVAAIHDLTGFGRCSLSVIIPVLSTMGIQVCSLPTAILSTHPGGFDSYYYYDLTDNMKDYVSSWKKTDIIFDCLYSGFLGSEEQIDIVADLFETFKTDKKQLVVVDPVMADNGKLYAKYSDKMPKRMRSLIEKADVITPNVTEASLLIGDSFSEAPMSDKKMKYFLKSLSKCGPELVIITSVMEEDGYYANIGYSRSEDRYWKVQYKYIPVNYPGTGDIFSSIITGAIMLGDTLPSAIKRATQFISLAIDITYDCGSPAREGVMIEKVLSQLNNDIKEDLVHMEF